MVIGLIGAIMILVGDFLAGWGVRDENLDGIRGLVSPYLTISDYRRGLSNIIRICSMIRIVRKSSISWIMISLPCGCKITVLR
jgi:hypothetical protein